MQRHNYLKPFTAPREEKTARALFEVAIAPHCSPSIADKIIKQLSYLRTRTTVTHFRSADRDRCG